MKKEKEGGTRELRGRASARARQRPLNFLFYL